MHDRFTMERDDDVTYVHDDVTYVYDDVTYVYDDECMTGSLWNVTLAPWDDACLHNFTVINASNCTQQHAPGVFSIECVLYRMCSLPCHQRLQLHPTARSRSLCVCPYVYALMCMPLYVCPYMYVLICMPSYVCPYVYIVNSCSEGENNMNMMHTL